MTNQKKYQEIPLGEIKTNPFNPRKNFQGPKYEDLVASIRKVGVIEPILVRPVKANGSNFEIVAGERRYRALCQIAGDNGKTRIPSIIQEMTDDESFDLMTIENLQREDLTEIEEARNFKAYLDRKGREALPDLADRVGINPRYIKRRITVLSLPANVLEAWEDGKIKYGHCEQLCRLKDKKQVLEYLKMLLGDGWMKTVKDLKRRIDSGSIPLKAAKFDTEKAGCATCQSNSDVQRDLFDENIDGTCCLDHTCFKKKQGDWLTANWKKYGKAARTNGFRFDEDLGWDKFKEFADHYGDVVKPVEKCFECQDFISRLNLEGRLTEKQCCAGNVSCYSQIAKATAADKKKKKQGAGNDDEGTAGDAPRVAWHGEYFREAFLQARIPEVMDALQPDDDMVLRCSLKSLLVLDHSIRSSFRTRWMARPAGEDDEECEYIGMPSFELWDRIAAMDKTELLTAHRDISREIILQRNTGHDVREKVASSLGIDLAREWRLNRDYFDKKTISEINAICEKFKIFEDPKAQAFLHETLGKKRGKFNTCKKEELVRIVLESGIDLAGKVPDEILDVR